MRRPPLPLLIVLALFAVYAGVFIANTSFTIHGERYLALFDDAMISMTYAKNVAEGHGAVWNPGGERIEGYSNPLWMFVMAAVHLLPISTAKTSLVIQLLGAFFLALNVVFVWNIGRLLWGGAIMVALPAAALTAFYYPLNYWGLTGNEVGVLTCITTFCAWRVLHGVQNGRFSVLPYLLLFAAVLVRMDMVIPFFGMVAYAFLADKPHRFRHLAVGGGLLVAVLVLQAIVRTAYYGDTVPNTYYLKLTGYPTLWRVVRGLSVFVDFVWQFNPLLFAIPFVFIALHKSTRGALLLGLFGLQCAYSVWVGGDAWESHGGANRYLSISIPLFLVLLCGGVATLARRVLDRLKVRPSPTMMVGTTLALALLSLLNINAIHGLRAWKSVLLMQPPLYTEENEINVRLGLALREFTNPEATVAVLWAGALPYFADCYAIDVLGKNDRHIAKQKAKAPSGFDGFKHFVPGHTKWDYDYSVGELKPDVVVSLIPGFEKDGLRLLEPAYEARKLRRARFFLRKDSSAIAFDRVGPTLARFE